MKPERLDAVVAEQTGITRSQARSLIMEGRVRVNGVPATKAGANVREEARVEVERPRRFVSRGGEKLDRALERFHIAVEGVRALDIGASTGGFTDALLQRGASYVVAVDVGYGQIDWKLRNDPRVTVLERTNFRHVAPGALGEAFSLIVIDTSFISLRTIAARAVDELTEAGDIVALVKPQFEAGRERLGAGGVVRDPQVHRAVLREVRDAMLHIGLPAAGLIESPLLGPAGNREFLLHVRRDAVGLHDAAIDAIVDDR
ncbi:MAG: TlyA family RNA methyltransferase [Candidatus Eremiobacteraeota bacterium]|nr:TlyA family RNA methyltransferase [Candidatus Eremiobacteraeota bacterium]